MTRITCTQKPLSIPHLGVQFVDGVAEVDDEQLAQLGAYRVHGVVLPGDEPAPEAEEADVVEDEPEVKPKTTRSRAAKPFG
jgi:deoxyhypusine synthase